MYAFVFCKEENVTIDTLYKNIEGISRMEIIAEESRKIEDDPGQTIVVIEDEIGLIKSLKSTNIRKDRPDFKVKYDHRIHWDHRFHKLTNPALLQPAIFDKHVKLFLFHTSSTFSEALEMHHALLAIFDEIKRECTSNYEDKQARQNVKTWKENVKISWDEFGSTNAPKKDVKITRYIKELMVENINCKKDWYSSGEFKLIQDHDIFCLATIFVGETKTMESFLEQIVANKMEIQEHLKRKGKIKTDLMVVEALDVVLISEEYKFAKCDEIAPDLTNEIDMEIGEFYFDGVDEYIFKAISETIIDFNPSTIRNQSAGQWKRLVNVKLNEKMYKKLRDIYIPVVCRVCEDEVLVCITNQRKRKSVENVLKYIVLLGEITLEMSSKNVILSDELAKKKVNFGNLFRSNAHIYDSTIDNIEIIGTSDVFTGIIDDLENFIKEHSINRETIKKENEAVMHWKNSVKDLKFRYRIERLHFELESIIQGIEISGTKKATLSARSTLGSQIRKITKDQLWITKSGIDRFFNDKTTCAWKISYIEDNSRTVILVDETSVTKSYPQRQDPDRRETDNVKSQTPEDLKREDNGHYKSDENRWSPFHHTYTAFDLACQKAYVQKVKELLQDFHINKCNRIRFSPIYESCLNGESVIVRKLLTSDIKQIDLCDEKERSSMYLQYQNGFMQFFRDLFHYGQTIHAHIEHASNAAFRQIKNEIDEQNTGTNADFIPSEDNKRNITTNTYFVRIEVEELNTFINMENIYTYCNTDVYLKQDVLATGRSSSYLITYWTLEDSIKFNIPEITWNKCDKNGLSALDITSEPLKNNNVRIDQCIDPERSPLHLTCHDRDVQMIRDLSHVQKINAHVEEFSSADIGQNTSESDEQNTQTNGNVIPRDDCKQNASTKVNPVITDGNGPYTNVEYICDEDVYLSKDLHATVRRQGSYPTTDWMLGVGIIPAFILRCIFLLLTVVMFAQADSKIKFHLMTDPAYFGGNVTVSCQMESSSLESLNHMAWYKDITNPLALNNHSFNPSKYQTGVSYYESNMHYDLTILQFAVDDVNIIYRCDFGFETHVEFFHLDSERFIALPKEEATQLSVNATDGELTVFVRILNIYPMPRCHILYEGHNYTENANVTSEHDLVFYNITLVFASYVKLSKCRGVLDISCYFGSHYVSILEDEIPVCKGSQEHIKDETWKIVAVAFIGVAMICIPLFIIKRYCNHSRCLIRSSRLTGNKYRDVKFTKGDVKRSNQFGKTTM